MEYLTILVLTAAVFFLIRALILQKKLSSLLSEQKHSLENQIASQKALADTHLSEITLAKNAANTAHLYGELLAEEDLSPEQKDLLIELLLANETVIHILKKNSV